MTRDIRPPAFRLPVTPDDVVRHALAAYYRAVGDAIAPIGEPDRASWSNPAQFLDTLADFFQLRLHHEAAQAGHPVEADSARYLTWSATPAYGVRHIREVDPGRWAELCALSGAGRSPAHKGHGCPASAPGAQPPVSAVGPAATESKAVDITTHANPLCAAHTRQGLPVGETSPHTQSQPGETPC